MTPSLIVADLMGTTIRHHEGVGTAFRDALAAVGDAPTDEQIASVRGATKRAAIATLVSPGADHERRCDVAYLRFRKGIVTAFRRSAPSEVPGAFGVLARYRSCGIRIALITGFERELALDMLGVIGCAATAYDTLICGDDVAMGRPAPYQIFRALERTRTLHVEEVVSVGDTVNDLLAGARARVRWNVGVLTGAHDRERLEGAPHTHLVDSIADLCAVVPFCR